MIVRTRGHVTVQVEARVRVEVRVRVEFRVQLRLRLRFMLGFGLRFSIVSVGLGFICHIDSWRARSRLASSSSRSMRSARA